MTIFSDMVEDFVEVFIIVFLVFVSSFEVCLQILTYYQDVKRSIWCSIRKNVIFL